MQQKCKSDDDRSADKELYTESVATRENQDIETKLFCKVVKNVSDN